MAPAGARGFTARFDWGWRDWKMDDHFFTVYDVLVTLLAIIGGRAGTHGTHRTCVLVYKPWARSSWSFGTCSLSPVFFTKVCVPCVPCVLCVLTEKIRKTRCVPSCVPMCSPEKGLASSRPSFAPLAPLSVAVVVIFLVAVQPEYFSAPLPVSGCMIFGLLSHPVPKNLTH